VKLGKWVLHFLQTCPDEQTRRDRAGPPYKTICLEAHWRSAGSLFAGNKGETPFDDQVRIE
jgi:hypothetical protein